MHNLFETIIKESTNESIISVSEIKKGFSSDKKYVVTTKSKREFLVKLADAKEFTRKEKEFNVHVQAFNQNVKTNEPIIFRKHNDYCLSVFSYIKGLDASEVLPRLSVEEQYNIGYSAGKELRKIHTIKPNHSMNWYEERKSKYERYWSQYQDSNVRLEGMDKIHTFIMDNLSLIIGRPISIQHDDFQVNNIIIENNKYAGVIDFNRFDIGDPIHDFYKLGQFSREVSVPFSVGQIDGYYENNVPNHFWELYNLYIAMIIVPSIVWSVKVTPQLVDEMLIRLQNMINDQETFSSPIPKWYMDFKSAY
ncbi:aminoglycoside phosphotransferase family protein [Bacillus alkalisoli]|uniref:aminoglycoside phosphotransferase family protein n=1 Tax=Bacillus alkalisoli TaxID=2011008 RepID=UPI0012FF3A4E|nr:phosphotransferase [Bacillus alkalisoli]